MTKSIYTSGFVYIWFDRKHRRFYIGSHWGTEDDNYICSSRWMRKAYRRRPKDFVRRILARIFTNRKDLLIEEWRWLSMIKPEERGKRYYNLKLGAGNFSGNQWWADERSHMTTTEKMTDSMNKMYASPRGEAIKKQIAETLKTSPAAIEARVKLQDGYQTYLQENGGPHNKGVPMSEDQKEHLRQVKTGKKLGPNSTSKTPIEKILAYKEQGLGNKEIAELLGVSHSAVCNAVRRAGGTNSGTPTKTPTDELKQYLKQGMKITEIAQLLGLSQPAVSNAIKRSTDPELADIMENYKRKSRRESA